MHSEISYPNSPFLIFGWQVYHLKKNVASLELLQSVFSMFIVSYSGAIKKLLFFGLPIRLVCYLIARE